MAINLAINLTNDSRKFLKNLIPKHHKQVAQKIVELGRNPYPSDSKHLSGHRGYKRVDSGEYRIIYTIKDSVIYISAIGNRNDDAVYRKM